MIELRASDPTPLQAQRAFLHRQLIAGHPKALKAVQPFAILATIIAEANNGNALAQEAIDSPRVAKMIASRPKLKAMVGG